MIKNPEFGKLYYFVSDFRGSLPSVMIGYIIAFTYRKDELNYLYGMVKDFNDQSNYGYRKFAFHTSKDIFDNLDEAVERYREITRSYFEEKVKKDDAESLIVEEYVKEGRLGEGKLGDMLDGIKPTVEQLREQVRAEMKTKDWTKVSHEQMAWIFQKRLATLMAQYNLEQIDITSPDKEKFI
jgi:hypothetical protein